MACVVQLTVPNEDHSQDKLEKPIILTRTQRTDKNQICPSAKPGNSMVQALRHMKHLRDEGTQPDATQQSQIALSARQQLVLDPQITTPQLPTPPQKSVELLSPPTTPGLGYTPDTTPAANPANTPAATMSQHPSFRLAGSQLHNVEASLGPGSDKSRRQQAEQQPAEAGIVSSALLRGDGSTKRWQGALYNVHPVKGEEYVCELTTDAWPAHLPRYACQEMVSGTRLCLYLHGRKSSLCCA